MVKVNVFHAAVWGSNPGDVYFILLSQSFFFSVFFFIIRVRVSVMLSFLSDNVKYRFQTRFVDCCAVS